MGLGEGGEWEEWLSGIFNPCTDVQPQRLPRLLMNFHFYFAKNLNFPMQTDYTKTKSNMRVYLKHS